MARAESPSLGVLGARVPDAATMGSTIDQPSESEWHLMAKERAFSNHLMTHILEGSLSGVHLDAAKTLTSMVLVPVKAGQVAVSKGSLAKSGLIMAIEELYGHLQHMADEGWLTYWSDLCISGLTLPAYMLYRVSLSIQKPSAITQSFRHGIYMTLRRSPKSKTHCSGI